MLVFSESNLRSQMVRIHTHNSLLLSQDPKSSILFPPHLSMKPQVTKALCQSWWGRVIGGGDANDWLIGVNWLRRKEEYRESYWKDILSKLPKMASESKVANPGIFFFFFRGESE